MNRVRTRNSPLIFLLFCLCSAVQAREIIDLFPEKPEALFCWTESISLPRTLKAHFLMVDLTAYELEVMTLPGDDPDGDGPAESQLTSPVALLNKFNAMAAVNANAFAGMDKAENQMPGWYEGQAVDIHGMVVSNGKTVSKFESGRTSFWLDREGKPHIGNPEDKADAAEAVADWFSPLIVDSKRIPDASDSAIHPRTALGFDDSGEWLLMAVIDGRQPSYSEGVTLLELARLMENKGCTQAINLDGGGSSIMLIREQNGTVRTFNRPSAGVQRPIPVMLGVRKR